MIGRDGSKSPWSEPLLVEAGLLEPGDWQATFVGPAWDEDLRDAAALPLPAAVVHDSRASDASPRVSCTALGVYEVEA